ncbi:LysR family transcriptional regulator [Actinoplanes sp. NPDC026623]|uniref:LysR family transcriptional regulator n=1 Tax=Actinoplanes sp. NPDC026623 TaxID=3155610 RepID=UPI0033C8DE5C
MLDVRRLHLLTTVAARGSITAAAQSLGLTPGAVSQQLSALRRDLGVDLLRPDGRTVTLTDAGRVLVAHADRILAAISEAESAVAATTGTVGTSVTLAALPSTAARIVAPALHALTLDHPQLTVRCLIGDAAQQSELRLGSVDVILAQRYHHMPRPSDADVRTQPLLDDPILVVTAPAHAPRSPVPLADLATHRLALAPPDTDCGQAVLYACRQAGFTPDSPYLTADITAQLTLARAGLATALVPAMAIETTIGLSTTPIAGNPIHRQLYTATRHTDARHPTIDALTAALRTAAHPTTIN